MMGRIRNLVKLREPTIMDAETQQRPPPPPGQSKKQARRRLHASKPYQERLLNMAEARKEIAAALRFHRAAMKHQQNQPSEEPPPPPPPPPPPQPVPTRIYYSRYTCKHPFPCSSPPRPYPLPNHPLCPKCNMETAPMPSAETCLSPAAESKPAIETPTLDSTLHPAMGDKEMEEIRSVGERHDWEWNDSVNLLTSALWSRFLETVDGKGEAFRALGEAIDIPTWLSDGSGMDHHMDDHLHVVSFPWL